MMIVRFKTGVSPYQSGELAGFPEAEARRLIKAGLAEEYVSKKAEIEKETEAEQVKAPQVPPADKMVDTAPNKQIRKK